MARGKANVNYMNREGMVAHTDAPNWDFIYTVSKVKDPQWNIGDRVVLPDGREFVYAKSSAACISGQGCEFTATGAFGKYPITTVAIGGKQITLANSGSTTVLTHAAAYAKDVFRGGYVVMHDAPAGDDDVQFRGIIGNDYSAINAVVTIYLDGPLAKAIDTTTFTEVFENPYAALRTGTSSALPKAGVPAVQVSAADMYFWVQTRKFCWVAPQSTVVSNQTGCWWRHDGSLQDGATAYDADSGHATISSQYAGHTVEGNYDGNGPLFNLQS